MFFWPRTFDDLVRDTPVSSSRYNMYVAFAFCRSRTSDDLVRDATSVRRGRHLLGHMIDIHIHMYMYIYICRYKFIYTDMYVHKLAGCWHYQVVCDCWIICMMFDTLTSSSARPFRMLPCTFPKRRSSFGLGRFQISAYTYLPLYRRSQCAHEYCKCKLSVDVQT